MHALRAWQYSFLFHAAVIGGVVALTFFKLPETEVYDVPIEIEAPREIQNLDEVKEKPKVVLKTVNEQVPEAKPAREIFGANRDSYTDSSVGADGVDAKKGNTLAKEVDKTVLLDSDAGALPTPTEEYLVSEMPSVLSEVRPVYPPEARKQQLEGVVVLDVLIDDEGSVRQVGVIEGPAIFRSGALDAMKKFKFKPAKVDGKSVAVRIRYSLNFKLEY